MRIVKLKNGSEINVTSFDLEINVIHFYDTDNNEWLIPISSLDYYFCGKEKEVKK
jgi:hypothetical protein